MERAKITIAVWFLLAFLIAGCTVPSSEVPSRPPAGEWKTSAPAQAAAQPIVPTARAWKGITPTVTTKSEVDSRFRVLKQTGELSFYRIDLIDAAITYDAHGKVVSIRTAPALDLSQDQLTGKFGKPDRVRQLKGGGQALDYDGAGLSIEYAERGSLPVAIDIHAPSKVPSAEAVALFDAAVPVRPPLTDIRARIQRFEAVLGSKPEGFSWVGVEREQGQAAQVYSELDRQGLLMNAPDLQSYADGLMGQLSSITPQAPGTWKLIVMKGALPNAMNIGGGYIFVTQGIIEHMQSEAQLAFVVSHECQCRSESTSVAGVKMRQLEAQEGPPRGAFLCL